MLHWLDVLIFIAFASAGAWLMRWADMRVEEAVRAERARCAREWERQTGEAAPLPLLLDDADALQLRQRGAVVKRRVKV